ncbi:MAG: Hsp33 family molecular chaperone HslO [Oscillospiraceae bacterium]|nr:Hsp33 family molecular chaperone HslO [Oscillospiraceae bacterium]
MASLGKQDLEEIASGQEEIEVCCHFCNKVYRFTPQEVRELEK